MMSQPSINRGEPVAFFLTWTTYGAWLPGDDRGWNRKGEPGVQPANPLFAEMAASKLKEPPFTREESHRSLVEETIRRHCDVRGWVLHAVNARTNHVHVVVSAAGYAPEVVREQFKAWCTRRLKAVAQGRARFWTEGGNCRWINSEESLDAAVTYVVEAQDRKGHDEV
jgi:hypothetical protein